MGVSRGSSIAMSIKIFDETFGLRPANLGGWLSFLNFQLGNPT